MPERTLVFLKPDAVVRGLLGEVLRRFERKGLRVAALKMVKFDRALAEKFYEMHKGKHFFDALVAYVTLAPVVAMVLEGENAIEIVRRVIGATDPREALPGTVRGDFGLTLSRNIVHGSDSRENAAREIALLFKEHEIFEYARADAEWLLAEK